MKTVFQAAALLIALAVTAFWFCCGHNTGWTKHSVVHTVKDPVTEIEGPVYEKRYVPGADFLGGGLITAGLIAGVSFFFRSRPKGSP